ncbi:SDR family oxidoreductase [Neorhizobium tomejilense]|uniref:SDR family oxidoreductase n=1 Tax=Neorhizobium tomejilense TaxID=2093828 RepID=UPI003ECC19CE
MDLELRGKVALITGAGGGIGTGIATELAREGADLCLAGRDGNKLKEAGEAIAGISGRDSAVYAGDLRDQKTPSAAVATAIAAFGRLDLLVNCAGDTRRGDFLQMPEQDWVDGFAVKFHGYVRMTRAAWPHLCETRGAIINIVGIGARAGSAEFTIGGSVNAALLNFTKAMADRGIREGVRVNAINPGLIETGRLGRNIERLMRDHSCSRDEAVSRLLAPRGTTRFGSPEEIGWLAAFLASPKAAFIQGALIDIDGGSTRAL